MLEGAGADLASSWGGGWVTTGEPVGSGGPGAEIRYLDDNTVNEFRKLEYTMNKYIFNVKTSIGRPLTKLISSDHRHNISEVELILSNIVTIIKGKVKLI